MFFFAIGTPNSIERSHTSNIIYLTQKQNITKYKTLVPSRPT